MNVQMRLGQQLLELGVLAFELLQPLGVGNIHAPELGAPLVESGIAEAAFTAQLLDWHPCIGLLQETDDLLFAVSALLHVRHSPWFDGLLYSQLVRPKGGRSIQRPNRHRERRILVKHRATDRAFPLLRKAISSKNKKKRLWNSGCETSFL